MVYRTIKALSSDYRGKYVTLFSERSLDIRSCTCKSLAVHVVCLSHDAKLGLAIDVNMKVIKPYNLTYLMEMVANGLIFSAEGEVNVEFVGFEFIVVLNASKSITRGFTPSEVITHMYYQLCYLRCCHKLCGFIDRD